MEFVNRGPLILTADALEIVGTVIDDVAEARYVTFWAGRFAMALLVYPVDSVAGVHQSRGGVWICVGFVSRYVLSMGVSLNPSWMDKSF